MAYQYDFGGRSQRRLFKTVGLATILLIFLAVASTYRYYSHPRTADHFSRRLQSSADEDEEIDCDDLADYKHHGFSNHCDFVKEYCDEHDGIVHYLELYYCTFDGLEPLSIFIFVSLVILLFHLLGDTAEEFFCPCLQALTDIFQISPNVAGVTFLAFGNGAPDCFSSIAAFLSGDGEIGLGAILGAGMFVTSFVFGAVIFFGGDFTIHRRPFLRDLAFYFLSLIIYCLLYWDRHVSLWQAVPLPFLYVVYVAIVILGRRIYQSQKASRLAQEQDEQAITTKYGPGAANTKEDLTARLLNDDTNEDMPSGPLPIIPARGGGSGLVGLGGGTGMGDESRRGSQAAINLSRHGSVMGLGGNMLDLANVRGSTTDTEKWRAPSRKRSLSEPSAMRLFFTPRAPKPLALPQERTSIEENALRLAWNHPRRHLYHLMQDTHSQRAWRDREIQSFSHVPGPVIDMRLSFTTETDAASSRLDQLAISENATALEALSIYLQEYTDNFSQQSFIGKCISIAMLPFLVVRYATIPTFDDEHWNRFYACLVPIGAPLLFVDFTGVIKLDVLLADTIRVWVVLVIAGIVMAVFVWYNTSYTNPPPCKPLLVLAAFLMCIVWIAFFASELVALLSTLGTIWNISPSILGMTVLAWGNSVGDLASNIAIARAGSPGMAAAGCFAAPILNCLIGLGGSLTIESLLNYPERYDLDRDLNVPIAFGFLFISILSSMIIVPLMGFHLRKVYGIYLMVLYTAFLLTNIVVEVVQDT